MVIPKTIIFTDEWKVYKPVIEELGYLEHYTVCHKRHFDDLILAFILKNLKPFDVYLKYGLKTMEQHGLSKNTPEYIRRISLEKKKKNL